MDHKRKSLVNCFSLLVGYILILLQYLFIDNIRDQYILITITILFVPVIFHTQKLRILSLPFICRMASRFIKIISSKLVITFLLASTFLLSYDFKYINLNNNFAISSIETYWLTLFLSAFIIYLSKYPTSKNKIKYTKFSIALLGGIFILFMGYFEIIHDFHRYNENSLNLGIVFNPIIQVFHGATVLIDTKSQYGLYPHFLEPILKLTGLSITSISVIMGSLFVVTLGSWFYFLIKITRSYFLSLVGLIAATFSITTFGTNWPGEIYYQYLPLRTIFPALLLLAFPLYYDNHNWYGRVIIGILLSIGVLWNIESGAGAFLAFLVMDAYLQYDIKCKLKSNIVSITKNTLISILVLLVVFLIFFTIMKLRSGHFPILHDFFWYIQLYGTNAILGGGFSLHPHMLIMILFYFLGINQSIGSLLNGSKNKLDAGIFVTSVLGLGTSAYYFIKQYHSTHEVFALYLTIILATLFASKQFINLNLTYMPNRQAIKDNALNIFYVLLTISYLSFMVSMFFVGYKNNPNISSFAKYHEIVNPSVDNEKTLGIIKCDNDLSNPYSFDLIRISDLVINRFCSESLYIPKWIKKANALKKYKVSKGIYRKDLLIISNYDYFLYLKLNAKAPVKIANIHHVFHVKDYKAMYDAIRFNKDIRYVIIDNEELIHPEVDKIYSMYPSIKKNFKLIESYELDKVWFWHKSLERSEAKSWGKNYIEVYERID